MGSNDFNNNSNVRFHRFEKIGSASSEKDRRWTIENVQNGEETDSPWCDERLQLEREDHAQDPKKANKTFAIKIALINEIKALTDMMQVVTIIEPRTMKKLP